MVILRLAKGVQDHFQLRVADWIMASALLACGLQLAPAFPTLQYEPYAIMLRVASEQTWASFAVGVGIIRLLALTINGTFPRFRYSPYVRAGLASLSVLFWATISLSLWFSTPSALSLGAWPFLLVTDVYNVYLAGGEAASVERAHRRNGSLDRVAMVDASRH